MSQKIRNPRASFIIPAHNAELWVSKTIHSCREQSIKDIEIIVSNDASTDFTQQILEHHASLDPRVRVFNREKSNASAARNFAIEQAKSDLLIILDADDYATRNRVKDTLTAFSLKKPDYLYGSFFMMDTMGTATTRIACKEFDADACKKAKMNFICHSTVAFTKKLWESVRFEEGMWSDLGLEDWKMQWEIHKLGKKMYSLKNPLCYYRIRESGTTGKRDPKKVEEAKNAYLGIVEEKVA